MTRVDERKGRVFLPEGGVMAVEECTGILLPSQWEARPDPEIADG